MKKIAIIPIRSGSKTIKNKNIKKINNKPLFYYSLNACIKSKIFDEIIISSDSSNYLKIVQKYFKNKTITFHNRSKKNSLDQASTESVITEILKTRNAEVDDICYLVQCTSPMVLAIDLVKAYKLFKENNLDSLFTGFKKKIFIWSNKKKLKPLNYNYKNRPRRQNFEGYIFENGAFYIFKTKLFKLKKNRLFGNLGAYLMPEIRSLEIDEKEDLILFRKIIKK